jgi:hypothetical protein
MLFRVVEHYDFHEQEEEKEKEKEMETKNECLLCLEINTDDKLTPVDLRTQQVYLKVCKCGGWFHITCLHEWYDVSKSCPICRVGMKKCYDYDYQVSHFLWISVVFLVRFCNIFWFFFVWGVVGVLGSYNVYLTYAS